MAGGARVAAIKEDLEDRGIAARQLIADVEVLGRRSLAGLYGQYDRIWQW